MDVAMTALSMNTFTISSGIVAVILSSKELPHLVELSETESISSNIQLMGEVFADSGAGDWLGFYDWLRNSEGQIIGIRQYIDNNSVFPFSRNFTGVNMDANLGVVHIFLGSEREFDNKASCDQDFGCNRLMTAGDKIALTFCKP